MNEYILQVNEVQLREIRDAMEIKARLYMGQFDLALNCLLDENGNSVNTYSIINDVKDIINDIPNFKKCSLGMFEKPDLDWEIYTSIRYTLAWDKAIEDGITTEYGNRNWKEMMTVDYDEPLQYTKHPLPIIKKLNN